MPLIKRTVSPVNIALTKVAEGTRNELECVTNSSLCSIIRQLSSLSRHAEDMFAELVHDAAVIFDKTNNLQERVGRLKVKVTQLDSTVEEGKATIIIALRVFFLFEIAIYNCDVIASKLLNDFVLQYRYKI